MKLKLVAAAIAAVVLLAIGYVVMNGLPGGAGAPDPALGARLYAENCASCHGANLEGQPDWRARLPNGRFPAPPHDATGHTWHHDDATLFGIIKLGTAAFTGLPVETDMRGFKDVLSDDDIRAVIAFIKSRWPERVRQQQESINQRAGNR